MGRERVDLDTWQYGERSSTEIRSTLLELVRDFVSSARNCPGVERIAVVGSILSSKARPKDVDVLVTITDLANLAPLAKLGRRLNGSAQARLNSGADVFLADSSSRYLGRICHYRECHPRVLCRARHCGAVPHLSDDLDLVTLDPDLIVTPPVELHPTVLTRVPVPEDVERVLVAPFREVVQGEARG